MDFKEKFNKRKSLELLSSTLVNIINKSSKYSSIISNTDYVDQRVEKYKSRISKLKMSEKNLISKAYGENPVAFEKDITKSIVYAVLTSNRILSQTTALDHLLLNSPIENAQEQVFSDVASYIVNFYDLFLKYVKGCDDELLTLHKTIFTKFFIDAPILSSDYEILIYEVGNLLLGENYASTLKNLELSENLKNKQNDNSDFYNSLNNTYNSDGNLDLELVPLDEKKIMIEFMRLLYRRKVDENYSEINEAKKVYSNEYKISYSGESALEKVFLFLCPSAKKQIGGVEPVITKDLIYQTNSLGLDSKKSAYSFRTSS